MAVPLTGTASPTLPTKSQLTAWNNTSDETFITGLVTGGGHLGAVFRVTVTGHSSEVHHDLDHQSANLSNSSKSCGARGLNSWLIGSLMVTTTLHTSSIPPWGMLWFSARRKGTNPASPVITNCYHSYPSQHV